LIKEELNDERRSKSPDQFARLIEAVEDGLKERKNFKRLETIQLIARYVFDYKIDEVERIETQIKKIFSTLK